MPLTDEPLQRALVERGYQGAAEALLDHRRKAEVEEEDPAKRSPAQFSRDVNAALRQAGAAGCRDKLGRPVRPSVEAVGERD